MFDAIAIGTWSPDNLVNQLDVDREFVEEAVAALKRHELIAEATDGSLYAAQRVGGVGPYVTSDEHIIDCSLTTTTLITYGWTADSQRWMAEKAVSAI